MAYLQALGANQVKQIADNLGSEEARAALHAIVGCAGAAASSQSCGAGAMGAATSSVLGSLLAPSTNLSASEREARDNLVTSLVAGVAAVSGQNVATAAGAGKIEVENNQLGPGMGMAGGASQQLPPGIPGYKGEQKQKGDGAIVDNATELDPTIKSGGPLIYPMPDAKTVGDWITEIIPDQVKGLVDYILTQSANEKYQPNQGGVGNMKEFMNSPGFGSELKGSTQKTNYQFQGQSVYEATEKLGGNIKRGDLVYLDGLHKDHLEVFDKNGNFKAVLNLDGSRNEEKTRAAETQGRKFNVR